MRDPAKLENAWVYLYDEEVQSGPMTYQEACQGWKAGLWSRHAFYWMEGMPEWLPALHLFESGSNGRPPMVVGPEKSTDTAVAERKKHRVMVVDDDPILCEILKDMLVQSSVAVDVADGFNSACQLLEKNGLSHYDCVVTDYLMPDGNGTALARWIKQREHALQVLLLTAQDNKEVVKLGLRAGVFDFQEKPLRPRSFNAALQSAIQQTIRQREERAGYLELIQLKMSGRGGLAEQFMTSLVQRETSVSGLLVKLEAVLKYTTLLEKKKTELLLTGDIHSHEQFQGKIGELSLLDLAQLLIQSDKTGELQVLDVNLARVGSIFFTNGLIRHAEKGSDRGRKALLHLIPVAEGYFNFIYSKRAGQETITGDSTSLLLQISSELDELNGVTSGDLLLRR